MVSCGMVPVLHFSPIQAQQCPREYCKSLNATSRAALQSFSGLRPSLTPWGHQATSHVIRTGLRWRSGSGHRLQRSSTTASVTETETVSVKESSTPTWSMPPVKEPKRVVLLRHGESTWNQAGRIQGSSDFAVLTSKGEAQAETSRQMLINENFDALFISPLARAKRTAEIVWGSREGLVTELDDLREIDLYAFQGLFKHEGKERFGPAYSMWQKDAANFEIDGHYPVRELWARARTCWEAILASPGKSVLVVAHNAVNQALVATAAGLGPEYFRALLQSNCGVSAVELFPGPSVKSPPSVSLNRLNQTASPPTLAGGGRKVLDRVIFVCQGARESSVKGLFPIAAEEPLNFLGSVQSRKAAELLLDVRVDLLFCSPAPSAKQTAAALREFQNEAHCLGAECNNPVEVEVLEELRELDWGAWRGLPRNGVSSNRWEEHLLTARPPGGEPLAAGWRRAGAAWGALLARMWEERGAQVEARGADACVTAVVVADELTLVALVGHCLGLDESATALLHLDAGSLSMVDFPDPVTGPGPRRGVLRCANYTAHLGRWAVPVTLPAAADEDF